MPISSCRDRALLVSGSNTAKQATLVALLDPIIPFRPPLTHTSHHRPALVNLNRFRVSPILTHSRFRRSSTCVSAVSGVSFTGVSLLSADLAVVVLAALLDPSTHHRAPLTHASDHRPTLVHLSRFRVSPILTQSCFRRSSSRFSSRSSSRFWRFLFPEQSQAFQAFLIARGHISASFHLERSNKGPLESSRQGAHDRIIPTVVLGVSLAVPLAVPLAVSGVSYFTSSLKCFRRSLFTEQSQAFQAFLMARGHISASFHL